MMFERRLFLKPICATEQDMVSGVAGDSTTGTYFYMCPWDHLCYLKRIEINRGSCEASGCFEFEIWDSFYDPKTNVSGVEKRKSIIIPLGTEQINWDETSDIPILGDLIGLPTVSGVDATLCIRTMGA